MSLYDEIAKVAHEFYERDGGTHGRDLEHWFEAEKIVLARKEEHPPKKAAAPKKNQKTRAKK